jgi:hypothetical protein
MAALAREQNLCLKKVRKFKSHCYECCNWKEHVREALGGSKWLSMPSAEKRSTILQRSDASRPSDMDARLRYLSHQITSYSS